MSPSELARLSPQERILMRVVRTESGCWNWTGKIRREGIINGRRQMGYASIRFGGKKWAAHRLSWIAFRGEIPDGQMVLHECDNPKCVNPAHLFLGDALANAKDCVSKGRQPRGEKSSGAKLTDDLVKKIRSEYKWHSRTGFGMTALAEKYKLAVGLISDVINRKRWAHVP